MSPHHLKGILLLVFAAFVLLCTTAVALYSFVQCLRMGSSKEFWRGYDAMGENRGGIFFLIIGLLPSLALYLLLVLLLFTADLVRGRVDLKPNLRNRPRSAAGVNFDYQLDKLTLWVAVVPFALCVVGLLAVALFGLAF